MVISSGNMEGDGRQKTGPRVLGLGSRQLRVEGWVAAAGRGQASHDNCLA